MTNTINVFLGALLLVLLPPVDVTTATIEPARTTAGSEVTSSPTRHVLAISVDGLNPAALRRLGPARTPTLHRLVAEGAATLNARTARERTMTLPNHTTMVTGRRVDRHRGGHGVAWNDERPRSTVQRAARHPVSSVFAVVRRGGGSTALFAGKSKLSIFPRSWPGSVDRFTVSENATRLVELTRRDLLERRRELTFLHVALPDVVGHEHGFMTAPYLDAVARTDVLLGRLVRAVGNHARLREHLTIVLTADHGGRRGASHYDPRRRANYTVPFLAWGAGVAQGDLYAMNPARRDPGTTRTTYADARQPVRNGDLANLVTDLLGLPAVPGSGMNAAQDLSVGQPVSASRAAP